MTLLHFYHHHHHKSNAAAMVLNVSYLLGCLSSQACGSQRLVMSFNFLLSVNTC